MVSHTFSMLWAKWPIGAVIALSELWEDVPYMSSWEQDSEVESGPSWPSLTLTSLHPTLQYWLECGAMNRHKQGPC